MSAFPTMRPSRRLRRRVQKTWLCPASWPMKPSWVNVIPTSGATARAAHELPAMTSRAHPAKIGADRQGDLHPVVARPAVEQAHRPYLQRQRAKAGRGGIGGSGRPCAAGARPIGTAGMAGAVVIVALSSWGVFRARMPGAYAARVWSNDAAASA